MPVDPAIDPNQKINDIIIKAFILDEIIETSYKIERLPFNARKLDKIIESEMQMAYTDDELKEMSYDTLLAVRDEFAIKKLNFAKTKKEREAEFVELTKAIAREQGISPAIFAALVKVESNFNSKSISTAGAIGLCQIIPENFKHLGIKDPFDILQNLRGGAKFYKMMLNMFEGNISLALAAYNAGPGAVQQYNNNVPPYAETISYIEKVVKQFREYKQYRKGLTYDYGPTKEG
jgi:soluble lytic murein transglycosylase-like protein